MSYLSTDVVRLAPISDKPSVLQYGMLVVDQADTNLYIYKTGGWTLVGGSGSGTGDVNVSGTTAANTIAYWNGADSTLVSDDVVKLYADSAVFTEPVVMHDSTYLMGQGIDLSDVWWGGTSNGAMDTGHVENAWYGLIHALDNPMTYLNDTKEVEGHLELKVWYIDDKTGEPACQYGIKGLSPTEAATAFQINHEFMTRYVADHEARLQKLEQAKNEENKAPLWRTIASIIIFIMFMILLTKQHIRLTEIESERINNRR